MTKFRGQWLSRSNWLALVAFLIAGTVWTSVAEAQRRPAPELLPDETLVYVRIPDIQDFVAKMQDTAMGQMLNDDEVSPFVDSMYDLAAEEFEQLREQVGLSLDEILELPQGELCFALVATKDAATPISGVLLLDVGDSVDLARIAEEKGESFFAEQGVEQETEDVSNTTLKIINANDPEEMVVYFERDGTYGISNNTELVKEILLRWNLEPGSRDKVFSNNRKFVTIMNRCKGTSDARPDLTFFVDPVGIFKATQSGAGGAIAMAFARSIGVTGLLGIGGSYILGVDDFDAISHMHIYLASPREGVMKMMAMKSGDIEPPTFVPADAVTYMTLNWDIPKTFDAFEELFNKVSQDDPDALNNAIENNINENLGVDFREDIIGNLAGRLVYMTYMVPPARINSQSTLVGMQLLDGEAAEETLATIFEQEDAPELEEREVRGTTVYLLPGPGERRRQALEAAREAQRAQGGRVQDDDEDGGFENRNIRMPQPCFAIVDDYFLFSDAFETMEYAIETADGRHDELSAEPDFVKLYQEVARQIGSERAGMIAFTRPNEVLRSFYELGVDEGNRQMLRDAGEDNPFLGRFNDVLEDNPLPPFEVMEKYLSTAGGVMTADESGFHYFSFGFRPKVDE